MSEEQDKAKDVTLVIKCVVKDYHACDFTVEVGEEFVAKRKWEERRNAFKVTNQCGQLGHLQAGLVSPLWHLNAEINALVNFKIQFQMIFLYLIPRLSLYFVDCRTVTGPPANDTHNQKKKRLMKIDDNR